MHDSTRLLLTKIGGTLAMTGMLAAASIAPADAAAANDPVGRWLVTWSNDATPGMAVGGTTYHFCFLSNGTWYDVGTPSWNGRWFQKGVVNAGNGDHVSMHGYLPINSGLTLSDSGQLDFVHVNMMTGPYAIWVTGTGAQMWLRVALTREGTCGPMPPAPGPAARVAPPKELPMGLALPQPGSPAAN